MGGLLPPVKQVGSAYLIAFPGRGWERGRARLLVEKAEYAYHGQYVKCVSPVIIGASKSVRINQTATRESLVISPRDKLLRI